MRFYTQQHRFYCGIDLPARTMDVCILNAAGEMMLHRHMQASPEAFLKALAPYREELVVAVECIFTWSWRADRCAPEGLPFVLGHALSMKAIPGGQAKNDTIDAQKMAALLRGGLLPQAYGDPAQMRATRALLRRRIHLMRTRSELWAHVQHTNSQDTLPEIGKNSADKANRAGVAERFAEPAVQKSLEVDCALLTYSDQRLRDLELSIVKSAKQHDAHTFYRLRSVPGVGTILALVLLYEIHDLRRFPSVQDFASYGRLVTCARASAGKRHGNAGTKIGNADLTWAFAEAAVWFLRNHHAGQKDLARFEKKHGQGKALTILAHQLARAVYDMLTREPGFDLDNFLCGEGEQSGGAERLTGHPRDQPVSNT
jgi:transposase